MREKGGDVCGSSGDGARWMRILELKVAVGVVAVAVSMMMGRGDCAA